MYTGSGGIWQDYDQITDLNIQQLSLLTLCRGPPGACSACFRNDKI